MFKHIFTMIWNRKGKNALMVTEIFFAFIILFSILSFTVYIGTNMSQPMGFVTEPLWFSPLSYEGRDSMEIVAIKETLERELEQHPAIKEVSFGNSSTPLGGSRSIWGHDNNGFYMYMHLIRTDEDFKEVADLNVTHGRWFTKEDYNAAISPILVTQQFADEFFKGVPPLDSVYHINGEDRKIIGVVDHYRYTRQFDEEEAVGFFLQDQGNEYSRVVYMRMQDGTGAEAEEEVYNLISQITKIDDVVIEQVEKTRQETNKQVLIPITALLFICGFLVINVALGLFGVLWYNISKRRGEIGLRRTLGASKGNIAMQFITEILIIAGFGIFLAALFCVQVPLMDFTEMPDKFYYQAIGISTAIILVLVLVCALYPSQQAARISPAIALHEE